MGNNVQLTGIVIMDVVEDTTTSSNVKRPGIRYRDAVKDLKLHPENIAKFQFPETPPWTLTPLNINLEIAHAKKSDTIPAFYEAAHIEIVEDFPGYNLIYTYGSLSGSKAASAAVLGDKAFTLRLPVQFLRQCSSQTVEP